MNEVKEKPVPQDIANRIAAGIKTVLDAGYTIQLSRSVPDVDRLTDNPPIYHGALLEGAEWRTGVTGRDYAETMLRLLHTYAPTYFTDKGEWQSVTLDTPEHDTLDVYDTPAPPDPEGKPMWDVFEDRMNQDGICTEAPSLDELPNLFPPDPQTDTPS